MFSSLTPTMYETYKEITDMEDSMKVAEAARAASSLSGATSSLEKDFMSPLEKSLTEHEKVSSLLSTTITDLEIRLAGLLVPLPTSEMSNSDSDRPTHSGYVNTIENFNSALYGYVGRLRTLLEQLEV